MPIAASVAALHVRPQVPQGHEQRQPAVQPRGRLLREARGRRCRMADAGFPGAGPQHRPATEGGFAGTGGGRAVERLAVDTLQQQGRRWLLRSVGAVRLAPGRLQVRPRRVGGRRRHGGDIHLAQANRLALLQALAEQVEIGIAAMQPGEIGGGDLGGAGGLGCGVGGWRLVQGEVHRAARLVIVRLPGTLVAEAEQDADAPGLGIQLDPLEPVGVAAAGVDVSGGEFQAGAAGVRGHHAAGQGLAPVAVQQEIAVQVNGLACLVGIECCQVVPRMVHEGDAPVRALGVLVQHGLVDLVASEQQVPVLIPARPGRSKAIPRTCACAPVDIPRPCRNTPGPR
jgi:hypothetical protein